MFNWLFTEEHKAKRQAAKELRAKERKERQTGTWERDTAKPTMGSRPKPAPWWNTSINNTNVNVQSNGHSYQRTSRNGVEKVVVDGKVLTGAEAKAAKAKHENWVDDFKEDMADFAEDMRDMAKDMRDMFK